MSSIKFQQFEYEIENWKRSLEFMKMENVFLKTRLAQITKSDKEKDLLELVEFFHAFFINEDETIAMLRNDVAKLDSQLRQALTSDNKMAVEIVALQKRLRLDMETEERRFNKLKFEFNDYFAERL
jgi:regulator of replication initiation timing